MVENQRGSFGQNNGKAPSYLPADVQAPEDVGTPSTLDGSQILLQNRGRFAFNGGHAGDQSGDGSIGFNGKGSSLRDGVRGRFKPAHPVVEPELPGKQQPPGGKFSPPVSQALPPGISDTPQSRMPAPQPRIESGDTRPIQSPGYLNPGGEDNNGEKPRKPYQSQTSKDMNKFFEQVWRGGAYVGIGRHDILARNAAFESALASQPLVTRATQSALTLARDDMLVQLRNPIATAERQLKAMMKNYPAELFEGANGRGGAALNPARWDLSKLTASDRALATKYLNFTNLRHSLMGNWPPTIHGVPDVAGLSKEAWIKAAGLETNALRLEGTAAAYRTEASTGLARQAQLRASHHGQMWKQAGVLGGAFVTNMVIDAVLDNDKGPGWSTYLVDLASPLIMLTNRRLGVKFAVMTVPHLLTRLYDKVSE